MFNSMIVTTVDMTTVSNHTVTHQDNKLAFILSVILCVIKLQDSKSHHCVRILSCRKRLLYIGLFWFLGVFGGIIDLKRDL